MLAAPQLDIRGCGQGFEILHDGKTIAWEKEIGKAAARARSLTSKLQIRPAICMCCEKTFTAHSRWNRLCDLCKGTYA